MNSALRVVLWFLGHAIAQGSRFLPSLRAQITRSLTFELSAGDRVARHWVFDGQLRRATTHAGHAEAPDYHTHFATSFQALRMLLSPKAVDKIVSAYHHGTVQIHGSAFYLLWFYGLTRKFVRIGRGQGPRQALPGAYLAHDPAACGDETIIVEPAVKLLDPDWYDAWNARAKLWNVRGQLGEPLPEP